MFFCFGKKIYATHWYKNLAGKLIGAQGYFFKNPTIEFTNLLVKQWCRNSLINLSETYTAVKKGSSPS